MSSKNHGHKLILAASALAMISAAQAAPAADSKKAADHQKVERLPLPDGNEFPISSAVTVKAGTDTYLDRRAHV